MFSYPKLKRLFDVSFCYDFFQDLIGTRQARQWLQLNFWRLSQGDKIVDVGCGTGDILNFIPEGINYIGFDINEQYIVNARKKYGAKGEFFIGEVSQFRNNSRFFDTDLVTCNGVLHHLDTQQFIQVVEFAKAILRSRGRMVCIEPCFLMHQDKLSTWLMKQDRGAYIRYEDEWKQIVGRVFTQTKTYVLTGLVRFPFVHIVIECTKD